MVLDRVHLSDGLMGSRRCPTCQSHRLPDQLRPNLRLVFVGTAA